MSSKLLEWSKLLSLSLLLRTVAPAKTIVERLPYIDRINELSSQALFMLNVSSFQQQLHYGAKERSLRNRLNPSPSPDRTILISYQYPEPIAERTTEVEGQAPALPPRQEPYRLLQQLQRKHEITYEHFMTGLRLDIDGDPNELIKERKESETLAANVVTRNIVLARLQQALQFQSNNSAYFEGMALGNKNRINSTYLNGLHMEVLNAPDDASVARIRDILKKDPLVKGVWLDEIFEGQQDVTYSDYRRGESGAESWFRSSPNNYQYPALPKPPLQNKNEGACRPLLLNTNRTAPNDKHFCRQWAHVNEEWGIRSVDAWKMETGADSNFIIALIDSGVDLNHPDLRGRIWRNPRENCDNDKDDDQNGYKNDCIGWDWVDNDNIPQDENGHGTASAGILTATGNNNIGVAGVCWGCKLMILRTLDKNIQGAISNFIKVIDGSFHTRVFNS